MKDIIFHTKKYDLIIPRSKIIIGIIIGLLYAFSLYSLMYMTREIFRILSVTEDYDLWILTFKESNFYNLFFAFISVIIAQSVSFSFIFDSPKKIFKRGHYKLITIINDQRGLSLYFLNWFSKLAIVFGIMFGLAFHKGFYVFSFYPKYEYVFILIVIVLFLQTWNTIRVIFKQQSLKWMLFSILIISVLSLGLSKINLIDSTSINEHFLSKNINYQYKLKLPKSDNYEIIDNHWLTKNIYVVKSLSDIEKTVIIFDSHEIDINDIPNEITNWEDSLTKYYNRSFPYSYLLNIDKTIEMDFVYRLKKQMIKANSKNISYAIIPKNPKYDVRYYQYLAFKTKLNDWCKFNAQTMNKFDNIIELRYNELGMLELNNKPMNDNSMKYSIKQLIKTNNNYIIKFFVNRGLSFSEYFVVISAIKQSIIELRNEYSHNQYSQPYNLLSNDKKDIVTKKIQLNVFEKMID